MDAETAQWLALAFQLEPEDGDRRDELRALGDAVLALADDATIEELTEIALDAIASADLEGDIRRALESCGEGQAWANEAREALADLEVRGRGSAIVAAFVQRLAHDVATEGTPFFCLCCIDQWIDAAEESDRRLLAAGAAVIAAAEVGIGDDELRAAGRRPHMLVRRLATDTRRVAVRARVRRLAGFLRTSHPVLSAELDDLLAEPMPLDPADDLLWVALCESLTERLEPAFN